DPDALGPARVKVEDVVRRFDEACSRFREDSELTALNASSGAPLRVSPLLLEAVEAALRAARVTGGDVDPTVGEALIALGYDRDFAEVISRPKAGRTPLARVPGWHTVQVDQRAGAIRVARGVRLDLGATANA